MQIKLYDRATEATNRIKELNQELNDYHAIAMCIKALQAVNNNKDGKFKYTQEDYNKVIDKVRNLCAKHEIKLPDYVEWNSIEIL